MNNCMYCNRDNVAEARFCMECGRPLVRACPRCNKPTPIASKFCINCGGPMGSMKNSLDDSRFADAFEYFTDPRDGRVYKTIKLGRQIWMAENLNYGEMTTSSTLSVGQKWCYNNDEKEAENGYGGFYTWEVAMLSCPPGWHLPSLMEWQELEDFVISQGFPEEYMGTALKTTKWGVKDGKCIQSNGTDAFGFNCLLAGGIRCAERYDYGYYWSAAEHEYYTIGADYGFVGHSELFTSASEVATENLGLSVRCVKD